MIRCSSTADTPLDFGYVIDRANRIAQANLATLVPGARHVTDTHSGHNMMVDQPQLVTDAIRGGRRGTQGKICAVLTRIA